MSPQAKFDTKWVAIVITVIGMVVAAFVWNTRVAMTYGKEQQRLEGLVSTVQISCENQIHTNRMNLSDQKTRFVDYCENKRLSDEKLQIKLDDFVIKQVQVMTNQQAMQKTLDKIDQKLNGGGP